MDSPNHRNSDSSGLRAAVLGKYNFAMPFCSRLGTSDRKTLSIYLRRKAFCSAVAAPGLPSSFKFFGGSARQSLGRIERQDVLEDPAHNVSALGRVRLFCSGVVAQAASNAAAPINKVRRIEFIGCFLILMYGY